VPTLRSSNVWQIWRFAIFLSISKRIAKVTDFLSFCPFGISIFPFLTIGISMYPSFFPFGAFQMDRQTTFFTPCYLSYFFHWARGALLAGATLLGWLNYGVDGRLNQAYVEACRCHTELSCNVPPFLTLYTDDQGASIPADTEVEGILVTFVTCNHRKEYQ